jgi:hypothetical protein
MVKVEQKLGLFLSEYTRESSILESRKQIQAGTSVLSGGLQSKSTPQRMDQCRKLEQYIRDKQDTRDKLKAMSKLDLE